MATLLIWLVLFGGIAGIIVWRYKTIQKNVNEYTESLKRAGFNISKQIILLPESVTETVTTTKSRY